MIGAAFPASAQVRGTERGEVAEPILPAAVDPCADDIIRLCPAVKGGGGRVTACLRQHEAALGAACREKLVADTGRARGVIKEFGLSCRADIDRYCQAVDPGSGRVVAGLNQHLLDLSNACQNLMGRLSDARDRFETVRAACSADVERLCAGVSPQAGPILQCLLAREEQLSPACRASDVRLAADAGILVEAVENMTRQENVREALQIFQGLDPVAFSRSQVLLQYDAYQPLLGVANGSRMLFNPQFVFGSQGQYALQVKVPNSTLYPAAPGAPTQFGLGAVTPTFAWNFDRSGRVRQYLSLGVQCETASSPPVGGPWAVVPAYAFGTALTRRITFTGQAVWFRSLDTNDDYPEVNLAFVEPILAVNLPGRSYFALDARFGRDFVRDSFFPLLKGVTGLFIDRQKTLSVSAWYQRALSDRAEELFFRYAVGTGIAYYFDW
jgi:hypothetical protein